jgi:hypothetical protein
LFIAITISICFGSIKKGMVNVNSRDMSKP